MKSKARAAHREIISSQRGKEINLLCVLSIIVNAIATVYKEYIMNSDEGVGFKL